MPDQPPMQPKYPISEIIEAIRKSRRALAGIDQKVEAAIEASRETLAQSKELLAQADAALLRR
ncbi:MAG TPA: hypothetical protein VGR45_10980 [Stellaceae bacterium]|nr:hypothetical protein [Stellaceae bacterium]